MTLKPLTTTTLTRLLLAPTSLLQAAEPKLAAVFSGHMVLQRDKPVPVLGWAIPGESVTVQFAGQTKSTTADPSGKWLTRLDAMSASAEATTLEVNGLVIADVLASGQSNMGYRLSPEFDATAIAAADHGELRFSRKAEKVRLSRRTTARPNGMSVRRRLSPIVVLSPTTLLKNCVVELKVPIGVIIISSVGAT